MAKCTSDLCRRMSNSKPGTPLEFSRLESALLRRQAQGANFEMSFGTNASKLVIHSHGFDIPSLWRGIHRMQYQKSLAQPQHQHRSWRSGSRMSNAFTSPDPTMHTPNSQKRSEQATFLTRNVLRFCGAEFAVAAASGYQVRASPGPERGWTLRGCLQLSRGV